MRSAASCCQPLQESRVPARGADGARLGRRGHGFSTPDTGRAQPDPWTRVSSRIRDFCRKGRHVQHLAGSRTGARRAVVPGRAVGPGLRCGDHARSRHTALVGLSPPRGAHRARFRGVRARPARLRPRGFGVRGGFGVPAARAARTARPPGAQETRRPGARDIASGDPARRGDAVPASRATCGGAHGGHAHRDRCPDARTSDRERPRDPRPSARRAGARVVSVDPRVREPDGRRADVAAGAAPTSAGRAHAGLGRRDRPHHPGLAVGRRVRVRPHGSSVRGVQRDAPRGGIPHARNRIGARGSLSCPAVDVGAVRPTAGRMVREPN